MEDKRIIFIFFTIIKPIELEKGKYKNLYINFIFFFLFMRITLLAMKIAIF